MGLRELKQKIKKQMDELKEQIGGLDLDDLLELGKHLGTGDLAGALALAVKMLGMDRARAKLIEQMLEMIRIQRRRRPEATPWSPSEDRAQAEARADELLEALGIE